MSRLSLMTVITEGYKLKYFLIFWLIFAYSRKAVTMDE
jgi:hypothetical protein